MSYEFNPFPYEYDALKPHISGQILTWHHNTHHQGHANGQNAAEETLTKNRETGEFGSSVGVLRDITRNDSGHILHDLFQQDMSPKDGDESEGALAERIAEDFGSYKVWKGGFETATDVAGSRTFLVYGSFSNQLRNIVVGKHDQGALWGSHPIFVLDAWEHSCYHDYGSAHGDLVPAFFEVVDWDEPAAHYEQAIELFE